MERIYTLHANHVQCTCKDSLHSKLIEILPHSKWYNACKSVYYMTIGSYAEARWWLNIYQNKSSQSS